MNSFMLLWTNTKPALRRPLKRLVTFALPSHNYIDSSAHGILYALLIPISGVVGFLPVCFNAFYIISGLFQMFGMSKIVSERSSALDEVESSLPLRTVSK